MVTDAKTLFDGKRLTMGPQDTTFEKTAFCCMSCGISLCDSMGFASFSFNNSFSEEGNIKKWTMSGWALKCCGVTVCCPSPIPCFACCGIPGTPCAGVFHWVQDPGTPSKWNATGGVCEKQCCLSMSNHDGDYIIVDAEHDGSNEKPLHMFGGKNPQTPPCFIGREMGSLKVMNKGGAPGATTMER